MTKVRGRPKSNESAIGLDFQLDIGYKIHVDGERITVTHADVSLDLPDDRAGREMLMAALNTAMDAARRNGRLVDLRSKEGL